MTVLLVLPTDSQIDSADHLQPLSTNGPSYCTFAQDNTTITSFHKTEVYPVNMVIADRIVQEKLQHKNWLKVDYLTGIQLAQNPT